MLAVAVVCFYTMSAVGPAVYAQPSPDGVYTASDVRNALARVEPRLPDALEQRRRQVARQNLSYLVSSGGKPRCQVFVGPDYTAVFRPRQVQCLSRYGGFELDKGASDSYQVLKAVTAKEVRTRSPAMMSFADGSYFRLYSVKPYTEPGADASGCIPDLLAGGMHSLGVSRANDSEVVVEYVRKRPAGKGFDGHWRLTFTGPEYLLGSSTQFLRDPDKGETLMSVEFKYTYHSPTAAVPVHMPKDVTRTEVIRGTQKETWQWHLDDYKAETLPRERFRLAYYGLANELTEDEDPDAIWVWVWAVAIAAVVGMGVVLLWVRRRRGRPGSR